MASLLETGHKENEEHLEHDGALVSVDKEHALHVCGERGEEIGLRYVLATSLV